MTQDDIMKLARKAGLYTHKDVQPEILAFANLVVAAERAKCLQIADEFANADLYASMVANAIRSRGTP